MSVSPEEMELGLAYWSATRWPGDVHNAFYRAMADANPRGAFDAEWWAGFLPVLRAWRATRPRGSAFLTSRAQTRFSALSSAWMLAVEPHVSQDAEGLEWSQVAAFPTLVAEIKGVASPVFASKFCHFLAPAVFPLVDNAAMGNPYPTYAACFKAYREEWLSTDEAVRQALVRRLTGLIGEPAANGYPTRNKVVELCLIGRFQGQG
ncbi:MAG: hypothetical protein WC709_04405 [Thermoleophilia bacterium]